MGTGSTSVGRLESGRSQKAVQDHSSEGSTAAILSKQDEVLDILNAEEILVFTSSAGAGGAATEAMTLTGLLAADTILSVFQFTNNANDLPLLGVTTHAADALTGVWSADPGAGAVIKVCVKRSRTTQMAKIILTL